MNLYAWTNNNDTIYTSTESPSNGATLYNAEGEVTTSVGSYSNIRIISVASDLLRISVNGNVTNLVDFSRDTESDIPEPAEEPKYIQNIGAGGENYVIKAPSVVDNNSGMLKFWSGTRAEYDAITTKDNSTLYTITDDAEEMVEQMNPRNVGQIVSSIVPLTDAGLHLLDGALLDGDGIYKEFVDYVASLVSACPNLFVSEEDWQTSVSTYGVCGKFVYSVSAISSTVTISGTTTTLSGTRRATSDMDAGSLGMRYAWYVPELSGDIFTTSTSPVVGDDIWIYENGTWSTTYMGIEPKIDEVTASIRLPKITGIIEGTTDVTALGDLVEAGLPNITGSTGMVVGNQIPSGAFYTTNNESNIPLANEANLNIYNTHIDASRSSSIYGNSSTVQPQAIKCYYYIVIATSTKTDIQVDIDEIATDLNGKADVDLTNCTDVANIKMAHNAMPSDTYVNLTLGASGTSYTAPADGYVKVSGVSTSSGAGQGWVYLESNNYFAVEGHGNQDVGVSIILPILKDTNFSLQYNSVTINHFRFYYAVGSESEAS